MYFLPDLPKKVEDIEEEYAEIWSPSVEELELEKNFE
jgi:hypothetical protein